MSTTVDERVVSMQFDNRHFEQNVRTSISTLDKLKKSLHLPGASKSLNDVSAAAKKCDLSPLGKSIDAVGSRFSAFEVVAVTTLANITNSAVNAGKRIIKALTLDPVTTGFSEYETKINAIQTIMSNTASKGTTMADVTRVIGELNTYADKTIYNFAEMTRNIGTFTAAGVGLEESAAAIKGIANLAAASGSSSQQASTAMYQLSQALAAGTVKLMDWNSVVNAGMGGEKFQLALKETAREHGIAVDSMIKKHGSFRESLSEGWITAEVLNDTLKKFTVDGAKEYAAAMGYSAEQTEALIKEAQSMEDAATKVKTFTQLWDTLKESAQSGWGQTWELIIGDFEEAKEFLTELSDLFGGIIQHFSDARNNLLGEALNSNWDKLITKVNEAGIETDVFTEKIRECAEAAGFNVDDLIKKYGSLGKAFQEGAISSDILSKAIDSLSGASQEAVANLETIGRTMWWGHAGDDVKELQKALQALNYDLGDKGVDGIIGNKTSQAIKEFQKVSGLAATGIVDKKTLDALKEATKGMTTLTELTGEQAENVDKSIDSWKELAAEIDKTGGRELLIRGLVNIAKSVIEVFKALGTSWKKAFDPIITSTGLYKAIERFSEFAAGLRLVDDETGEFNERGKQLIRIFDGIVAVIDVFTTITGGALKIALKAIGKALGLVNVDVLDLAAGVGDCLVAFRNWFDEHNIFAKGIEFAVKAIGGGITLLRKWVAAILSMPAVQKVLNDISVGFRDTLGDVGKYLSGGIERIKDFFKMVTSMGTISIDDLGKIFTYFKEHVIDYFLDTDELYAKFVTTFETIRTSVETNLSAAGEKIAWVKDKIVELAKAIVDKIPAAIGIGMGVMLIKGVNKIGNAMELLTSPLGLIEDLGDAITRLSKAQSFKTISQGVMNLAIAIGILAGSIAVLTLVDQTKLWSAVKALSTLIGVLALLAGAIALVEKFGDFSKASTAILMLSGALLLLTASLKVMESLDTEKAKNSALILGGLAAMLAAVCGVLGKFVPKLSSGSLSFLAVAAALGIMVNALVKLDAANLQHVGRTMGLMLTIVASLAILALTCGRLSFKSAVGVLGVVIGLKLLVGILEDLGKMDPSNLASSLGAFTVIFTAFAGLMIASKFAGKNAASAGVGILAISLAMLVIVKVIQQLSGISGGDLSKATDAVSQLLLVIGAVVALSKFAGQHAAKAGVMLLMISGAMLILSGVIHIIKDIPGADLGKATAVIAVLEILFGGLIFVTKYANLTKGTTGLLITLTAIIGVLALVIVGLSKLEPGAALSASASLSTLILSFAGALTIISKSKSMTVKDLAKAVVSLTAMVGVIALLAQIIGKLAACKPEGVIAVAAALSMMLLTLAGAFAIMANTPSMSGKSLLMAGASMLVLTGIVALLAQILGALAACKPEGTIEIATSISRLLATMAGVCAALAVVGELGAAGFIGIAVLLALIAGIGALMWGIGALAEANPNLEKFVNKSIPLLQAIGLGLGNFLGGLVGGVLEGISAGLPGVGQNLSDFMTNLTGFMDGSSNIDPSAAEGIKTLAEAILIITAADVLDGLTSFITGGVDYEQFGKDVAKLGPGLKEFSDSVDGINADAVAQAAEAAKGLADLANNLPSTGGKWQEWFGEKDLSGFATQMVDFGNALVKYSDAIAGKIDTDAIATSAEAAMGLTDLANNLPSTGGKWQEFFGEKTTVDTFGTQLISFGESMVTYSDTVAGNLDVGAINTSVDASSGLVDLQSHLPDIGGVWQDFVGGTTSIDTFGTQLESFGKSLVKYSATITKGAGLDVEAIKDSATVAGHIADFANEIPTDKIFDGKVSPSDFGTEIEKWGEALANYSGYAADLDIDAISAAITQANDLVDLVTYMEGIDLINVSSFTQGITTLATVSVDGFVDAFDGSHELAVTAINGFIGAAAGAVSSGDLTFKSGGSTLITNLIAGIDAKTGLAKNKITDMLVAMTLRISAKQGAFQQAGSDIISYIRTGIVAAEATIGTTITGTLDGLVIKLKEKKSDFETAGKEFMTSLVGGFKERAESSKTEFASMAAACATAIRDKYSDFKSAGKYLVEGFAKGMKDNTGLGKIAAAQIAKDAYNAAKLELQVNSPSKLFMVLGSSVAEGFAKGIDDNVGYATSSASDMANTTFDAMRDSLVTLNDLICNDIDVQPTIRPVLDLTNVESGSKRLSAIFSRRQALSVRSGMERTSESSFDNGSNAAKTGNTYQFTQINNSPKALSRSEIYRQTNNQFSAFERMVEA